jgi:hypothetical protein
VKTVWTYYKIATPTGPVDVPELYAFTDVKEYSKSFELTRNMDYFIRMKQSIDKGKFYSFLEKHGKLSMSVNMYETKKDVLSIQRTTTVSIVGPRNEDSSVFVESERISEIIGSHTDSLLVKCLSDKYLKMLNQFKYFDFMSYYPEMRMAAFQEIKADPFFAGLMNEDMRPDWMIDKNIKYDTLAVFLKLYGWTMKLK